MSAPIRIGLVGAGRIGRLHARLIAFDVPGLVLAGVYDLSEEAARRLGDELGVAVAPSASALMENSETDAIAICTSTDTHVDVLV